jgi:hypothetical protein
MHFAIPYTGVAPATIDLLSGQTDRGFHDAPALIRHIGSGALPGPAVTRAKRAGRLPEVPSWRIPRHGHLDPPQVRSPDTAVPDAVGRRLQAWRMTVGSSGAAIRACALFDAAEFAAISPADSRSLQQISDKLSGLGMAVPGSGERIRILAPEGTQSPPAPDDRDQIEDSNMNTTRTAVAAAGLLALASGMAPTAADAQCRGCGLGLGIAGGLIAGAIIGGAIANSAYPAYAVAPGYAPYPGYAAAVPVACPGGYWARRPLVDRFGNVVGYSRPRFFCP